MLYFSHARNMYAQSPIQGPTHRNPSLIYMHVSPVIECEACHLRAQKRLSVWQGHVGLMLASLEAVNTLWSWMRGGMEIGRDTSMWARLYFVCYWEVGWQSISVSNAFSMSLNFGWHSILGGIHQSFPVVTPPTVFQEAHFVFTLQKSNFVYV